MTHPKPPLTVAAATLLLAACQAPAPQPGGREYPGTLQLPTALPFCGVWQQHVTASWGEGNTHGFDAAVQRIGETLTVIALSPMGSVGLSIVQAPNGITIEDHMPEPLPFPPRFILLDVQRTLFPQLPEAAGVASPTRTDGEHRGERDGERIVEQWRDGRLSRRTFTRLDGEPAGELTIDYEWHRADWQAPTRAVLHNGWFGYSLTIVTHAERVLPTAEPAR